MAEWRKITQTKYFCKLSALELVIEQVRQRLWVFSFCGITTKQSAEIPLEQAKTAALSWARGVLGAALVEAGAVVIEENCCKLCGAIGPGSHCMFCSDEPKRKFFTMKPAKFARIDNA